MLFFAGGLLFKIVLTAGIVVAASMVVERSGPFIGSLIASLPTAGGATMIILALEHPPAFIAGSAVGSIVSNAICAVFALTYAVVAQRRSLAVSSNLHPSGFDEIMPKTLATATVDRLLHHAHVVVTQGDSFRLTQATSGQGVKPFN